MPRRFRPSEFDDTGFFPAHVSTAERRAQAAREAKAREARGEKLEPVQSDGREIAVTFWGRAWCDNLEQYSDFANRLPRGRAYLRNGYVVDLRVAPGEVTALVQGLSCYEVRIRVQKLDQPRWESVVARCAGRIGSLVELLRGRLSGEVMQIVTEREQGLFPSPAEIEFSCTCPDRASMCKHVAAALYGIGVRLDVRPELLFTLRAADAGELVAQAATGGGLGHALGSRVNPLAGTSLSELFGVPIAEGPAPATPDDAAPPAPRAPAPKPRAKQTRTGKSRSGKR